MQTAITMARSFFLLAISFLFFASLVGQSYDQEIVHKVADQMPLFESCDEVAKGEQSDCSNQKLIQFIIANLKYPKEAQDARVEGRVIVKFVISKDGTVRDAEVVKGIGSGCDEAARAIVDAMPNWVPGKKDGKDVAVQYTLPLTFKLPTEKKG